MTFGVEVSTDGANDEAMEASAERLMLASNGNGSTSGYSSDAETYDDQESGSLSPVASDLGFCPSSSLSSSSYNSSDESGDDSIDSEIEFLNEKCCLLQRAIAAMKEEETYDASRARCMAKGILPRNSPIWAEAREVLEVLQEEDTKKRSLFVAQVEVSLPPSKTREAKRLKIDLSSVACVSSADEGDNLPTAASTYLREVKPITFACSGPWVAEALVHALPSLRHQHDSASSKWEIVNDPSYGPLVVPPSKIPIQSSVELTDAIAFTTDAQ
jgi:hypothetical protein